MQSLRVLCVRKSIHDDYKLSALRTIHSILNVLRKRMEVKELWIVHEGGSFCRTYDDNIDTYNAFIFHDGIEIIRILRPDVVIIFNDYEYLERSILLAAASERIPTVDLLSSAFGLMELNAGYDKRKVLGSLQLLIDHPKSIVRRYLFLLRTLFRAGYRLDYIIRTILKDIYLPFVSWRFRFSFSGGDLNILSTPDWVDVLVKNQIDRSKIVVTGDISMDEIHYKLANMIGEPTRNSLGKIEILFITSPMVEHGLWTQDMRKEVVAGVVKAIREQFRNESILKVKIHPNNESLDVYKQLLSPIDSNVEIIQKADLLSLINNSDLVVCYGHSSAILEAVLLRKPVLIMNIFKEAANKNYFLREKIATECKSIDELVKIIKRKDFHVIDPEHLKAFLAKYIYIFDGKCSERAVNHIIALLCSRNDAKS